MGSMPSIEVFSIGRCFVLVVASTRRVDKDRAKDARLRAKEKRHMKFNKGGGDEEDEEDTAHLLREQIYVQIISASNLRNADFLGKSDPVCLVQVAGMEESRIITAVIQNCLDPVWNHQEELHGFDPDDDLDISLWDDDPGNSKPEDGDFLGRAVISGDAFYPKGMPKTDILLSDAGNKNSSITIQIVVVERGSPAPTLEAEFKENVDLNAETEEDEEGGRKKKKKKEKEKPEKEEKEKVKDKKARKKPQPADAVVLDINEGGEAQEKKDRRERKEKKQKNIRPLEQDDYQNIVVDGEGSPRGERGDRSDRERKDRKERKERKEKRDRNISADAYGPDSAMLQEIQVAGLDEAARRREKKKKREEKDRKQADLLLEAQSA